MTLANLYQFGLGAIVKSPVYDLQESRMSREDRVGSRVLWDVFFLKRERNIEKVFFITRFLQSLCRSRTESESQGGRVVRRWPYCFVARSLYFSNICFTCLYIASLSRYVHLK